MAFILVERKAVKGGLMKVKPRAGDVGLAYTIKASAAQPTDFWRAKSQQASATWRGRIYEG
jgi:hypothetical protein